MNIRPLRWSETTLFLCSSMNEFLGSCFQFQSVQPKSNHCDFARKLLWILFCVFFEDLCKILRNECFSARGGTARRKLQKTHTYEGTVLLVYDEVVDDCGHQLMRSCLHKYFYASSLLSSPSNSQNIKSQTLFFRVLCFFPFRENRSATFLLVHIPSMFLILEYFCSSPFFAFLSALHAYFVCSIKY